MLTVAAAQISARSVAMLEKVAAETGRLNLILSEDRNSTPCIEAALKEAKASKDELTLIIDARTSFADEAVPTAIKIMEDDETCGFAVPSTAKSALEMVLNMLQDPHYPPLIILRNKLLKSSNELRENLHFFALPEILLQLSVSAPPAALPPEIITSTPEHRQNPDDEQRAMDEENSILEEYQRLFFSRSFNWIPIKEITSELSLRINKVVDLFEQLKGGRIESIEEYDRSLFRYSLLAIYSGEVDSARQMLDTSFSVVGERPALMRIYKQLVMNFPIEKGPIDGPEKVSIVIPLFNQGHYLEEAVRSVLNQTYTNWEICIINDGSTDNSYEVAKELIERINDNRIRLLTQENRGKGATRNRGLNETDGEFVTTLDSDDMITPDYLASAVRMMRKNPRVGWVTPKTLVFGKDNHIAWGEEFNFLETIRACPSPSSSIVRRSALEEVGLFREDLTDREDAEFWLRFIEKGWTSVTTKEPLFLYRHACRRPGITNIFNMSSKEEITSLHPWWFRQDLTPELKERAFMEYPVYRFSDWFINWENVKKAVKSFDDRDKYLEVIEEIKSKHPAMEKPSRWQSDNDDSYLDAREKLFGVRSQKTD
ncbi:glycosyl transferase family 2 [Maridesulfovibrio salexigens DSM 2638]|uniref:Glycosyl transferase family 2 n=2 Tax=Maridesulfovibrio salexigens TaxID=880 RepID=C6BXS6_MARSD|nr:glycosyl transferase family 2 [Maridesulfovibrio salexigens DSM 2638]